MDKIVILDYGSQYNELLLRKLRDNGVYSLLLPKNTSKERIEELHHVKGIILSGGPNVISDDDKELFDERLLELNIPILGICYGMEVLARHYGAKIESIKDRQYDKHVVRINTNCPLFLDVPEETVVYMSKNDKVIGLSDVEEIAESASSGLVGFSKGYVFGLLFHPEIDSTEYGVKILQNFIKLCGCNGHWTIDSFIENKIKGLKKEIGDKKVILGLSGGVDSAVAALLLHEAIGDNLTCLFVETGLHRYNEYNVIIKRFEEHFKIKVHVADEGELFLGRLKGVVDPEEKRKVISSTFVEVFKKAASKLGHFDFLGQGTLYSDIRESKWGGKSKVIKDLPPDIGFKIIEPIKQLTKDEVRSVGRKLGLDESFITRQPFPFPGLAIRIIGEVTLIKLEILREANEILSQEIRKAHLEKDIYQYFCVLTNIDSVGVEGNNKIYYHTIAIRAVKSINGINADFYHFDINFLERVSRRIVNEVAGVNRVVYDITTKPPSTIEYQ